MCLIKNNVFFYILGTIKETTLCLRKWRSKSDEKGKTLLINNDCLSAVRRRGATRTFARGGVKVGFSPFSKIFQKQKCFFKGFEVEKKEILKCCMQIWLCSIQIDFLFL